MTDKKELLEKIKTHFSSQERIHFYVPEWDQDVYMTALSLREQDKINARAKDSPYQLAVYALLDSIHSCMNTLDSFGITLRFLNTTRNKHRCDDFFYSAK